MGIILKLKGGVEKEVAANTTIISVAKEISEGLARNACAALVDGKLTDLRAALTKDCELSILTFEDEGGRWAFRHTASHILAQAVKRLYPAAKLAIGPAIDAGFYYDIDFGKQISNDDLVKIEAEMKAVVKEGLDIEHFVMDRGDAFNWAAQSANPYKQELVDELPADEEASFYKQGEFLDLCAGPHLMSVKPVKAFKLTAIAGAYWRGSEKNAMLTRIYGTAFPKASELEAHLAAVEEAKKRDHNKVGRELKLFTTSDVIGQGLPLLMPKGAKVVQLLQRFVEDEEEKRGYVLTKTPFMAKNDLYKASGHWDHYKEGMFILGDEAKEDDEIFALRPMTCPFQFTIYNAEQHSYRDLPIRYNETSTLFRNEASGEMHGLIRVRQFTLSEGHLVCTREQLEDEFKGVVDLINFMTETLGIKQDLTFRFSKWDPNNKDKYEGDAAVWEETQDIMRKLLNDLGLDFYEAEGEAAFYGPKLDIQFKNVHGKEDTIITVQIDFSLAHRFNMTYIDRDGAKKTPIIIHRSSIGCYERTLAMLIEKFAGAFPVWLAPTQARILTITERGDDWAREVQKALQAKGIRVELDLRNEKIGYKIREARGMRVPYLLVIGDREAEARQLAVTRRNEGDLGVMDVETVVARIEQDIREKKLD